MFVVLLCQTAIYTIVVDTIRTFKNENSINLHIYIYSYLYNKKPLNLFFFLNISVFRRRTCILVYVYCLPASLSSIIGFLLLRPAAAPRVRQLPPAGRYAHSH